MGLCSTLEIKKSRTRLAAASDKVYQLLAHGRWFSPSTPASSTTKAGRNDIAEILLKVALNTKNQNQSLDEIRHENPPLGKSWMIGENGGHQ